MTVQIFYDNTNTTLLLQFSIHYVLFCQLLARQNNSIQFHLIGSIFYTKQSRNKFDMNTCMIWGIDDYVCRRSLVVTWIQRREERSRWDSGHWWWLNSQEEEVCQGGVAGQEACSWSRIVLTLSLSILWKLSPGYYECLLICKVSTFQMSSSAPHGLHSGYKNATLRQWQCSGTEIAPHNLMLPLFITDESPSAK